MSTILRALVDIETWDIRKFISVLHFAHFQCIKLFPFLKKTTTIEHQICIHTHATRRRCTITAQKINRRKRTFKRTIKRMCFLSNMICFFTLFLYQFYLFSTINGILCKITFNNVFIKLFLLIFLVKHNRPPKYSRANVIKLLWATELMVSSESWECQRVVI